MKKRLIALLALINDNNEVLISLRRNRREYDGYWEYPGGKVENSETLELGLIREIKEEINLEISKNCIAPLTFAVDQHELSQTILFLYICRKWEGSITSLLDQRLEWVKPIDLAQYRMPASNIFLNSILRDWV
ncbi:NUDIX domain-containing protein [Paracoccaceae bacterium]|nr:NUDIX domain-containing protein [Paracoccaceae bacterium]